MKYVLCTNFQYKDCNDDEILWRLARAARDMGKNASDTKYIEYTWEAFYYIQKALEINEQNFACHKVNVLFL